MFVFAFACGGTGSALGQASVATDQSDYPPGSTVNITGAGFQPNEPVQLQVLRIDLNENSGPEHQPWTVTADTSGNITATWLVTPDEIGATLQLTATGLTSGLTAQTTFTDGNAVDGDGAMTVLPSSGTAGSTITQLVFSFTVANGHVFSGGESTIVVPVGWTAPQTTSSSSPEYVSATAGGGTGASIDRPTAVSGTGPWTITIYFTSKNNGSSRCRVGDFRGQNSIGAPVYGVERSF